MASLRNWWDVIAFGLLTFIHVVSLVEERNRYARSPMTEEKPRQLGATTMASASATGITAVSILIPASLLIVQLGVGPNAELPREALENVFWASIWFLISLLFGLFLTFTIPMKAQTINVTRSLLTAIPFGPQLIALFVGVWRLIAGLHAVIYY